MITLQSARKYEELLGANVEGSPYDFPVLFKADGLMARQRAKKRLKLLKAIDPKLRRVLHYGEKVYFVTSGTTVTAGEQFFVGWLAYFINLRALVFTSSRILMLQINVRQQPGDLVTQLPYASIASVKSTWNGLFRVTLLSRRGYNFQSVPRADCKFLVEFLAGIVQLTNAPFEHKRGIENLCPYCYTYVPGFPPSCPSCSGSFKSARKAGLLSFLLPGAGGWYLGHRVFAVFEFISTATLWFVLLLLPWFERNDPAREPRGIEYWLMAAFVLLLAHVLDGMITNLYGRKGLFPATRVVPTTNQPVLADLPKPDGSNALKKLVIRRPST